MQSFLIGFILIWSWTQNNDSFTIKNDDSSCQKVGIGEAFALIWFMTTERYDIFKKEHDIPILTREQVEKGILQVPIDSLPNKTLQNLNSVGFSLVTDDAICGRLLSVLEEKTNYETFRHNYVPLFLKVNDNRYIIIHRNIAGSLGYDPDQMFYVFDTDFNLLGYKGGYERPRQ